jgi:hypothetical protein
MHDAATMNGFPVVAIPSAIGKSYVDAPGNNIDYRSGGMRFYLPKNGNLHEAIVQLMAKATEAGAGVQLFTNIAGEDVPDDVLKHSEKFQREDAVEIYGITGTDFILDSLYDPVLKADPDVPVEFAEFFLVAEQDGDLRYESPVAMLEVIDKLRGQGRKLGIPSSHGYYLFIEPLKEGKIPDFSLLGPISDTVVGFYDDALTRAGPGFSPNGITEAARRIMRKARTDPLISYEEFAASPYNTENVLALRIAGRRLVKTNPDLAHGLFEAAMSRYNGEVDVFCESRFANIAKASAQHVLPGKRINWQFKTRAAEGATVRHYTIAQTSSGAGARERALVFEIWDSGDTATANGLEKFMAIGPVPLSRMNVYVKPRNRLLASARAVPEVALT